VKGGGKSRILTCPKGERRAKPKGPPIPKFAHTSLRKIKGPINFMIEGGRGGGKKQLASMMPRRKSGMGPAFVACRRGKGRGRAKPATCSHRRKDGKKEGPCFNIRSTEKILKLHVRMKRKMKRWEDASTLARRIPLHGRAKGKKKKKGRRFLSFTWGRNLR